MLTGGMSQSSLHRFGNDLHLKCNQHVGHDWFLLQELGLLTSRRASISCCSPSIRVDLHSRSFDLHSAWVLRSSPPMVLSASECDPKISINRDGHFDVESTTPGNSPILFSSLRTPDITVRWIQLRSISS
ncbi:unnamed protein product [Caenorhabditis nigoni]